MARELFNYDETELKKLQNTEYEMLKKFDVFCKKNGISYFLIFGSALGAIRHNGFIPWDDDIDIGMLREDYEKLRFCLKDGKIDDVFLSDPSDDYYFHDKIFPRLYKEKTIFEREEMSLFVLKKNYTPTPIWIDIFVYDYIHDDTSLDKTIKKVKKCHQNFLYSKYKRKYKGSFIKCFVKRMIYYKFKFFHKYGVYDRYIRLIKSEKEQYIGSFDIWDENELRASVMKYNDYFPLKYVKFNDDYFPIMNNHEKYLIRTYGNDYMELPPQEKRVNHPPKNLKF